MPTPEQQQIAALTNKLNALENESRRILRALNWATKVRMILFLALLFFVLISCFMFYRLYNDVKQNRITQIQKIIAEKPEEFSEPLALQLKQLAEEKGPDVAAIFRQQADQDSQLYAAEFDKQREELIKNLQKQLEGKLANVYATMLDEQEEMLKAEFPVLEDPEKLQNIRNNMETVYQKISKRYYVDYLKEELQELAVKLDNFPPSDPRIDTVPVSEQIATEFLELVRMMLINSDHYVMPPEENVGKVSAANKIYSNNSADASDSNSQPVGLSADDDNAAKDKTAEVTADDETSTDDKKADDKKADDQTDDDKSSAAESEAKQAETATEKKDDGDSTDDSKDN